VSHFAAALRHRNFALVWFGHTISEVGNGAFQVALGWTVYSVTGSAAKMGVVLAANAIPQILLFLFGGVLGDRLPRRSVIVVANIIAGAVTTALALLAAASGLGFAWLIASAAALGVTNAIYGPAFGAIVADVLPPEHLLDGNALIKATSSIARIAGPIIAGALFAAGGASFAFGLDALSFAVAAACVALTSVPAARVAFKGTVFGDIKEGLVYATRTPWLLLVMAIGLVANALCVAPLFVLLPLIVSQAHGGPRSLGLALAVQMAVATVSALLIPKIRQTERAGLSLLFLSGTLGLGIVVAGVAHSVQLLLVGMAIIGVGFGFDIIESTIVQTKVPRELLSRVYGLLLLVSFALLPVGYAVSGVLAQSVGLTTVMSVGGLLLIATAVASAFSRSFRTMTTTSVPQA
jgi:DHA3 family tetracycline resistance protein-like MFS transporter